MITIYELTGAEDERRFSPYVWRTLMALAHKGLEYKGVPWRFTEKEALAPSGSQRVPVIRDGEIWVSDSWKIACYLEDEYSDRPSLFGGAIGRGEARFLNSWADTVLLGALFPIYVADIHDHLAEKDKAYFRQTREQAFGRNLEEIQADRDKHMEKLNVVLTPLRRTLKEQPFLCGDAPAYGDYIIFGPFQWVRIVSAFQCLKADDPIYLWRNRMLDLFGGLGSKALGYPVS